MKFQVAGVLISAALASSALAADLPSRVAPPVFIPPPIPAFGWTGCTIGVSGGYAFPNSKRTEITPNDADFTLSQRLGNVPTSVSSDRKGAMGGGGVGCKMQYQMFVIGADADASYTDLRSDSRVTGGPQNVTTLANSRIDFLGTARGTVGLPFDRALFYLTGGLAYGDTRSGASITPAGAGPTLAGSSSGIRLGYTVGGGIAYAFSPNWSIKAEYLYYDIGTRSLYVPTRTGGIFESGNFKTRFNGSVVRAGLDYKIDFFPGAPVVARY